MIFFQTFVGSLGGFSAYHLCAMSRSVSFLVPSPTFLLNVVFDLLLSPSFITILMFNFNAEKRSFSVPLLPPASPLKHQ